MFATGGIGSGIFASLLGNHTLGREESRAVHFLDRRDYCKGHIIAHYVKILLGQDFETILIGRVGDDLAGRGLLEEMSQAGIDVRFVQTDAGGETLYSVCLLYPDDSGCNLTSADSASSRVSQADIAQTEADFARFAGQGIGLAAPEVPLPARQKLLELAARYGFFRAGAFLTAEINDALRMSLFGLLDLVAINLDEAGVLAGYAMEGTAPAEIATAAINRLSGDYPCLMVSVTAGKHGSWTWDGQHLRHLAAFPTRVAGTAGAGDAHLAGILAGLASGLSLGQAHELGGLTAALAVASPHTIAPEVSRAALRHFARDSNLRLSERVQSFLQEREEMDAD